MAAVLDLIFFYGSNGLFYKLLLVDECNVVWLLYSNSFVFLLDYTKVVFDTIQLGSVRDIENKKNSSQFVLLITVVTLMPRGIVAQKRVVTTLLVKLI